MRSWLCSFMVSSIQFFWSCFVSYFSVSAFLFPPFYLLSWFSSQLYNEKRVFSHYILMAYMFPKLLADLFTWKNMWGSNITGLQNRAVTFYFVSDIFPVLLIIYIRLYTVLDKFWFHLSIIMHRKTSGNILFFIMDMLGLQLGPMHWIEMCKYLWKKTASLVFDLTWTHSSWWRIPKICVCFVCHEGTRAGQSTR